jgi:hypothetical protein
LRIALTAVALAFVAWAAWTLHARWQHAAVAVEPWAVAAAGLAVLATMLLIALGWAVLVRAMTAPAAPPLSRLLAVYASSSLGKYLPGKLGQPVLRITGLAAQGTPAAAVTASMLIEILSWMATGALFAALLFAVGNDSTDALSLRAYALPIGALALLGSIGLAAIDRRHFAKLARVLGVAAGRGPLLPWAVLLLHAGSWAVWAVHALLLASAVGADLPAATYAAGFFVLAPIAGFLALPLPAGVGVRESLVVLGLLAAVGAEAALAAALLSRALTLAADVVLWLVLGAASRTRQA